VWERGERSKKGEHRWTVPFKRLGQIAELTGQTKEWFLHGEEPVTDDRLEALEAKVDSRFAQVTEILERLEGQLAELVAGPVAPAKKKPSAG
jgi:hypothetical protein